MSLATSPLLYSLTVCTVAKLSNNLCRWRNCRARDTHSRSVGRLQLSLLPVKRGSHKIVYFFDPGFLDHTRADRKRNGTNINKNRDITLNSHGCFDFFNLLGLFQIILISFPLWKDLTPRVFTFSSTQRVSSQGIRTQVLLIL